MYHAYKVYKIYQMYNKVYTMYKAYQVHKVYAVLSPPHKPGASCVIANWCSSKVLFSKESAGEVSLGRDTTRRHKGRKRVGASLLFQNLWRL